MQTATILHDSNARSCSSCNRRWQCGLICVHLQVQQKLDNLAQQADANAMATIKGEEHVFTNNPGYMDLLHKMKACIMRKQEQSKLAQRLHLPFDETDEVSKSCFQLWLPQVRHSNRPDVASFFMCPCLK